MLACLRPAAGADLTPTELRWLHGVAPVVAAARGQGLPLDIVVQPQATAGLPPLAMAHVDGRCKLVFSMRGNPEAEATLERLPPDLADTLIELMTAHEIGHCHRHLAGAWSAPTVKPRDASTEAAAAVQLAEQHEEGYADLAGLAWVAARHPAQYGAAHAWLMAERRADRVPGGPHDTLPWLPAAITPPEVAGATWIDFAWVDRLWARGLADEH